MIDPKMTQMLCKLKSCQKCGGDLVLDGDEWRCWQCGQYYYPLPSPLDLATNQSVGDPSVSSPGRPHHKRRGIISRAPRDINSVIAAKNRSERRWWLKNRDIIHYLQEGRTIREISLLLGQGQRQIRVVRERLNDIRSFSTSELGSQ